LKGHQTRLDVIGNNIANVNTTGFKSSRVTFADTLSQTQAGASSTTDSIGGTNPKQIGLGTGVASIDLLFSDGSIQATGKNTDLCMSGNGLFVVKFGNDTYYTRNGAFEFDADGNYVLPGSGHFVQGWVAKDGMLATNGAIENIVVKAGKSMAAAATEKITYENNLNSAIITIASITGGTATGATTTTIAYENITDGSMVGSTSSPVTLILGDASIHTVTGGTYTVGDTYTTTPSIVTATEDLGNYQTKLTLADGTTHIVTSGIFPIGYPYSTSAAIMKMEQTITVTGTSSTASTTNPVTLTMSDGTTITETSGTYTVGKSLPVTTSVNIYDTLGKSHTLILYFTKTNVSSKDGNTWTMSLDSDLTLTSKVIDEEDGSTATVELPPMEINFTSSGKYNSGTGTFTITFTNGATSTQKVVVDFSNLTQYAGNNTIKGTGDGNAAGTLKSVSIDSSGVITGVYTNGVKKAEAQVAVAQFTNATGLIKIGGSIYQESNNSGAADIKTATDLGVTITSSALEMSNVDIANEFSDMIITQRGFQSNSKIITVSDEMLETLINMKR